MYEEHLKAVNAILNEVDIVCTRVRSWGKRDSWAEYNPNTRQINLNIVFAVVQAFIHEALHDIFPQLTDNAREADIMATRIAGSLSRRQQIRMYKKIRKKMRFDKRGVIKNI